MVLGGSRDSRCFCGFSAVIGVLSGSLWFLGILEGWPGPLEFTVQFSALQLFKCRSGLNFQPLCSR